MELLTALMWSVLVLCGLSASIAYITTRDTFHPVLFLAAQCAFMYGVMPLMIGEDLFTFVTKEQALFAQALSLAGVAALLLGCFLGTTRTVIRNTVTTVQRPQLLLTGGLGLGIIGLLAWLFTIVSAGGFMAAFGRAYGGGWSDYGYVRDAAYLLIGANILLLTPDAALTKSWIRLPAVVLFSLPWLSQGLLGARRGPTFVIVVTLTLSWYISRQKRPALLTIFACGLLLGTMMLFLVLNRSKLYIGSTDTDFSTDIGSVVKATDPSNEYIFGVGTISTTRQTGSFFWGKRYFAQVFLRMIPRQVWPDKYADFGLPELEHNAGVAGGGLEQIMGWSEIEGAAAGMVADLWVEFSWLSIPILLAIGYAYGAVWRLSTLLGGVWASIFIISLVLSIYLVTQSMEAVLFRFLLFTVPTSLIWSFATRTTPPLPNRA